ncbi:hypothetical protein D3C86_1848900 [compost metagenome]
MSVDDFLFVRMDGRDDVVNLRLGIVVQHFFHRGTNISVMNVVHQQIEVGNVVILEKPLVAHQAC